MKLTCPPWIAIFALALIAAAGGWLRYEIATQDLLWLDELHTGWVVQAPKLIDIAARAADGNQTPIFFWITYLLIQLPIQPELSLRLGSLIAGIALNVIAPLWVWRWSGSRIGALLTATLIASDLNFIYYSTEARPYALIELLSIFQFGFFCRLLWPSFPKSSSKENAHSQSNLGHQIPFSIISLVMIYTHLTSTWLLVAEAITLAICCFKTPPLVRQFRLWLPAATVIFAGFLPFATVTRNIYSRRSNWESVSSVSTLLTNHLPGLFVTVFTPLLVLFIYFILKKQQPQITPRQRGQLSLILLWAIVPFGCVILASLAGVAPLAMHRYTLIGAVAIPIFAGYCAGCFHSTLERITFSGLVICGVIFTGNSIQPFVAGKTLPHFRVENWKTPIEKINAEKIQPDYPVFVFANVIEDADANRIDDLRFQKYLLFPLSWPYSLDRIYPAVSAGPTLKEPHFQPSQIQQTFQRRGCWVIVRGTKELAERIGLELKLDLKNEIGKNSVNSQLPIQIRFYETPSSPVYLISVTW